MLGGRSMGGRMCSMAVAEGLPAAGLVLDQLPAAPAGQARAACASSTCPRLDRAVPVRVRHAGTRSARPDELEAATAAIPGPVTHVWIEGKGHDLKGRDQRIAEAVARWAKR